MSTSGIMMENYGGGISNSVVVHMTYFLQHVEIVTLEAFKFPPVGHQISQM